MITNNQVKKYLGQGKTLEVSTARSGMDKKLPASIGIKDTISIPASVKGLLYSQRTAFAKKQSWTFTPGSRFSVSSLCRSTLIWNSEPAAMTSSSS